MAEPYDILRDVRGVTWTPEGGVLLLMSQNDERVIGAVMRLISKDTDEEWDYFFPVEAIVYVGRPSQKYIPQPDEDEEEPDAESVVPEREVGPGPGEEADRDADLPQPTIT